MAFTYEIMKTPLSRVIVHFYCLESNFIKRNCKAMWNLLIGSMLQYLKTACCTSSSIILVIRESRIMWNKSITLSYATQLHIWSRFLLKILIKSFNMLHWLLNIEHIAAKEIRFQDMIITKLICETISIGL